MLRAERASRRAVLGVGLTFLFLASQLSSFTHLLLVRHVTCPEHGELIHADEAVATPAEAPGPALASSEQAASNHGHDHCLASTARREKLVSPLPGLASITPRLVPFVALAERQSFASVALLRLAPKSSPPA